MTERPPEGPKADFDAEGASGSPIPRPPSRPALDQLSRDQGMITDEWTGEPEKTLGKPSPESGKPDAP